ncbi:dTDP-4-amino-4,6-dideoxygalactose transaminase [Coralliovum pocilloporae]|uniref:dTDP-4-amino-4,6-dideoxygalactose transaminase n=1 Tax=Coralliovum pocilloporae TaxID=3066369 RepID=UPI003307B783
MEPIPLTKAPLDTTDKDAVLAALDNPRMEGGGTYSIEAEKLLEKLIGSPCAMLTNSGTAALDMAMILANVTSGDEVILPSYTFSSTATSVVLRGATPVFVDIDQHTYNICPDAAEAAITDKTKAIIVVHYAGVACDMERFLDLGRRFNLMIVEDAAHAIGASWHNHKLGSLGTLAAFSFHATKNISAGEAGALMVNDERLIERAEVILEKGTSRRQLIRGKISKYRWVDMGSSFLPSELTAALLLSRLNRLDEINQSRLAVWNYYAGHPKIQSLLKSGLIEMQTHSPESSHNAHLFCLLLPTADIRDRLTQKLKSMNISAYHHYLPLHDSPAGQKFGRASGSLRNTQNISDRLIRLPLYSELRNDQVDFILEAVHDFLVGEGTGA